MNGSIPILLAALLGGLPQQSVEEVQIPVSKLTISREKKDAKRQCPEAPACIEEFFKTTTSMGLFKIRYLSQSQSVSPCPHGSHCGISIPGLGNYVYYDNTVRVVVGGQDIMARQPADVVEIQEGFGIARVRFLWKLDQAELAVNVVVVDDRGEGFVQVETKPGGSKCNPEILVTGYPGGMDWPKDRFTGFEVRAGKGNSITVIRKGESRGQTISEPDWLWYGQCTDEEQYRYGSFSLLLLPEDGANAEVTLSDTGMLTRLQYPPERNRVRFAVAAYPGPNQAVNHATQKRYRTVTKRLRKIDFWPKGAE